jgi:hypothetical protein
LADADWHAVSVVGLVAVLALPAPGGALLRAIVAPGDRTADGFALATVDQPSGPTARDVVFSGET